MHVIQSQRQTEGMRSVHVMQILPISMLSNVLESLMCKLFEFRENPYFLRRIGRGICHCTLRRLRMDLRRAA